MPWLRKGDTAATHPLVMALVSVFKSDERTLNEVYGFVDRCATQSSAHMTDYRVDLGTALLMGGPRTELLLRQACEAGLLIQHGKGKQRSWSIVEDADFIHMPSKAETLWRRQRDRDRNDEALTVPVRARDGDECRYCGRIVNWFDRKGIKGGTYDHTNPGTAATVDTYVVACGGCNRKWNDTDADVKTVHLRPAPAHPFFSEHSAAWLTKRGVPTEPTPAQSESERAGVVSPGSTPGSFTTTARPRGRDTAAHARETPTGVSTAAPARDESTDSSTAATVRDHDHEAPQPPARATPWGEATAATTARPDFLSDPAATPEARPAGHAADTAPPQHMEDPPQRGPGSVPNQQITNRSDEWNPGRVGTVRVGSGAQPARDRDVPDSRSTSSPHPSVRARRGKRGRRSKKE